MGSDIFCLLVRLFGTFWDNWNGMTHPILIVDGIVDQFQSACPVENTQTDGSLPPFGLSRIILLRSRVHCIHSCYKMLEKNVGEQLIHTETVVKAPLPKICVKNSQNSGVRGRPRFPMLAQQMQILNQHFSLTTLAWAGPYLEICPPPVAGPLAYLS